MAKTVKITTADGKIEFYDYGSSPNNPSDATKVIKVEDKDGFLKVTSGNQDESRRLVVAGADRDLFSVIDDDSGLIAAYNDWEGNNVVRIYNDRMEFLYGGAVFATINANGLTSSKDIALTGSAEFKGAIDSSYITDKGDALGVAELDANGKVPMAQLPSAVVGGMSYQGVWDASSGVPALTPSKGWFYVVSVAGSTDLSGITDWKVGDWAVYNETVWNKIDNTDVVSSVNGMGGAVVLDTDDISEGGNKYYTEERVSANVDVAANTANRHTPFYLHVQEVASDTWTITHNLNRYASVTIIDSSNRRIIGNIEYLNANEIVVSFNGSFAGKAYLT